MKTTNLKILICSISFIIIATLLVMPFIVCQAGSITGQHVANPAYQSYYAAIDPMFPLHP